MTRRFEKSDEFGGFTIDSSERGFVIEYHAHREGDTDDIKILVPYGTWGFQLNMDLDAPHDEIASKGEALADMAMRDAKADSPERKVEILDEGYVIGRDLRPVAVPVQSPVPHPVLDLAPAAAEKRGRKQEDGTLWYSFSLKKGDADGYGKAHDLFATMFLANRLPQGMALWVTTNYSTGDILFFVQIPKGLDVAADPFFREFSSLKECDAPSRVGLLLVDGAREVPPRRWALMRSAFR